MTRVLLVEPNKHARTALRECLEANGYTVVEAADISELNTIDLSDFSTIVSSTQLPSGEGTNLLPIIGTVPLILVAQRGSVRHAVHAMKLGVADYFVRPFEPDEFIASFERIAEKRKAEAVEPPVGFYPMVGGCEAMLELFDRIAKVAPTESTVLIHGESGTGKELVARALHARSRRQQAPMISLNCAAIPESLIESELFGHERGAFTGASNTRKGLVEAAHGGTLFLDEIGELPLEAQARLLRVLQEGEIRRVGATDTRTVDVRLIAATHRDLLHLIETGHFREDLFYRLNVVTLAVPPLRDRGDDIPELAHFILHRTCEKMNKPALELDEEALSAVTAYAWPGNVRELENAIERAVILCDDPKISAELLAIEPSAPAPVPAATPTAQQATLEGYFVKVVLENQDQMTETELAQMLGISRKSLWERRQRMNIPRKRTRKRGRRAADGSA